MLRISGAIQVLEEIIGNKNNQEGDSNTEEKVSENGVVV